MSNAIVGFGKIGQALAHAFARKSIDVSGKSAGFQLSDYRLFAQHNFRLALIQTSLGYASCAIHPCLSTVADELCGSGQSANRASVTPCVVTIALA